MGHHPRIVLGYVLDLGPKGAQASLAARRNRLTVAHCAKSSFAIDRGPLERLGIDGQPLGSSSRRNAVETTVENGNGTGIDSRWKLGE